MVDALTKETCSGKAEQIPKRNSCLTRLLQESLGGNAKLSVICSISPDNKYVPGLNNIVYSCSHLIRKTSKISFLVLKFVFVDCRNNGETLRTLRFGQRVRSIRNEPVINEIKEDDVNDLSDQIRLLKVIIILLRDFSGNNF